MKSTNYNKVKKVNVSTIKTGNANFDDFLSSGGGFVVGSAIFLTGTAGAGKTTLSVVLQKMLAKYKSSLYSREMSSASVIAQVNKRYPVKHNNAFIADGDDCKHIDDYIKELDEIKPAVVIIDSLQVIAMVDCGDTPKEEFMFNVIQKLRNWADKNHAVLIVIGHVNKDGSFEGKNTIEHMFDAHLRMIYDEKADSRTLSWTKNRKGPSSKKLFYEFGDGVMNFYTPQQHEKIKNKKGFEDFLTSAVVDFLKSLDKTAPNYKKFKTEISSLCDDIFAMNISIIQKISKYIASVNETAEKYNLK